MHHAFAGEAAGFCFVNDIVLAILGESTPVKQTRLLLQKERRCTVDPHDDPHRVLFVLKCSVADSAVPLAMGMSACQCC